MRCHAGDQQTKPEEYDTAKWKQLMQHNTNDIHRLYRVYSTSFHISLQRKQCFIYFEMRVGRDPLCILVTMKASRTDKLVDTLHPFKITEFQSS